MSTANGAPIIRIGKKGRKTFAFGEEDSPKGHPFTIDVVAIWQQWCDVHRSFQNEEGTIPRDKAMETNFALMQFVAALSGARLPQGIPGAPEQPSPPSAEEELTLAEALDFMARIQEEVDALEDFFVPKLREKPSSPPKSATVNFSA